MRQPFDTKNDLMMKAASKTGKELLVASEQEPTNHIPGGVSGFLGRKKGQTHLLQFELSFG